MILLGIAKHPFDRLLPLGIDLFPFFGVPVLVCFFPIMFPDVDKYILFLLFSAL